MTIAQPADPPSGRNLYTSHSTESIEHGMVRGRGRSQDVIENILELSEQEMPRGDCATVVALGNVLEISCSNCGRQSWEFHEC